MKEERRGGGLEGGGFEVFIVRLGEQMCVYAGNECQQREGERKTPNATNSTYPCSPIPGRSVHDVINGAKGWCGDETASNQAIAKLNPAELTLGARAIVLWPTMVRCGKHNGRSTVAEQYSAIHAVRAVSELPSWS